MVSQFFKPEPSACPTNPHIEGPHCFWCIGDPPGGYVIGSNNEKVGPTNLIDNAPRSNKPRGIMIYLLQSSLLQRFQATSFLMCDLCVSFVPKSNHYPIQN